MKKLGLSPESYIYGGQWASDITRARNMTPRMVYEGKVTSFLESLNNTVTLELTTNWSPGLMNSMSLTTSHEWIGINPVKDKKHWDEFFTESELRHTGKYIQYTYNKLLY